VPQFPPQNEGVDSGDINNSSSCMY
jgi:hypothetical protein